MERQTREGGREGKLVLWRKVHRKEHRSIRLVLHLTPARTRCDGKKRTLLLKAGKTCY